jgi:hypothetical protein
MLKIDKLWNIGPLELQCTSNDRKTRQSVRGMQKPRYLMRLEIQFEQRRKTGPVSILQPDTFTLRLVNTLMWNKKFSICSLLWPVWYVRRHPSLGGSNMTRRYCLKELIDVGQRIELSRDKPRDRSRMIPTARCLWIWAICCLRTKLRTAGPSCYQQRDWVTSHILRIKPARQGHFRWEGFHYWPWPRVHTLFALSEIEKRHVSSGCFNLPAVNHLLRLGWNKLDW